MPFIPLPCILGPTRGQFAFSTPLPPYNYRVDAFRKRPSAGPGQTNNFPTLARHAINFLCFFRSRKFQETRNLNSPPSNRPATSAPSRVVDVTVNCHAARPNLHRNAIFRPSVPCWMTDLIKFNNEPLNRKRKVACELQVEGQAAITFIDRPNVISHTKFGRVALFP